MIRTAALLLVILSVAIYGCGVEKKSGPSGESPSLKIEKAYGDAIISGGTRDAIILNPILAADGPSHTICALIFDSLVEFDGDMNLKGNLAQSWEVSPDGTQVIFHIRRDIKWHDGYPFTAEDVIFTWQAATDPQNKSIYSPSLSMVENLRALDAFTLSARYSSPYVQNIAAFTFGVLPRHLLYDARPLSSASWFNTRPVGTGPFRFSEWKPDELISLVAYDAYHRGRPFIDRYVYKVIPDSSVLFLELCAGRIDMMSLAEDQIRRLKFEKTGERFNIFKYPGRGFIYMGYKLDNPLFDDPQVRRAFTMAIDRQGIIDGILEGMGSICTGPFYPGSWASNPDIKPLKHDQAEAASLLESAGWIVSKADGIREKSGVKLKFRLTVDLSKRERNIAAIYIQESLKKIGVSVDIERVTHTEMVNKMLLPGNFESFIAGWDLPVDPDIYDIWHSSRIEGGLNFIRYSNPVVDKLLESARTTFDQDARKNMYWNVHRIMHEEQPVTFLFVQDAMIAVSSRFRGIEIKPMGIFHDFIRWYVPKNEHVYSM